MRVVGHLDAEHVGHPGIPCVLQVLRVERTLDELLLELEAQDDVEAVCRLVRLDADEPGLGAVDGGEEGLEVDVAELRRERRLQRLVPVHPERARAADEVLPRPALRLVQAERRRAGERRALERRRDAVRVVAVARLMHGRPEPVEPALEARRHAHVTTGERRAERVDGRIEPVRALLQAERREDALVERFLRVDRERLVEERRVGVRRLADELGQDGPDGREDLRHLGRLHERLEVVEERRVRRVVPLEALDVPALEVEVPLQRREELREVVRRARLDPHLVAERSCARHLRPELRRDAPLLLPVAPRDADEARVVGVVVERLLERAQPVEQASDLVVREALVDDAAERRERLRPGGVPADGHRHLLIPREHHPRARKIRDLGEALPERAKVGVHLGGLYRRR